MPYRVLSPFSEQPMGACHGCAACMVALELLRPSALAVRQALGDFHSQILAHIV